MVKSTLFLSLFKKIKNQLQSYKKNPFWVKKSIILLLLLTLLPGLIFIIQLYSTYMENKTWKQELQNIEKKWKNKSQQYAKNTAISRYFTQTNESYFDSFSLNNELLQQEKISLENLLQYPERIINKNQLTKRLENISIEKNSLHFIEGEISNRDGVQEVFVSLLHPVEINKKDLELLINTIEGYKEKKPHCIITELEINKQTSSLNSQTYFFNCSFIQRTYE